MDIRGTITENLQAALASATRLRGRPIYADTLAHWRGLLAEAQRRRRGGEVAATPLLDELIADLGRELADRDR